tara:strand:- start:3808 stop:6045 length:2238 start_codon:yes stop_codon:yes gene_type:complete
MKNNNEILSISLLTISVFIFISLIQFDVRYNLSDIYDLLFLGANQDIPYPITGPLGASISALLKKYFLGNGSFVICSIIAMYSYLLFTKKNYADKKYQILSIYQLLFGLWLAIFFAWRQENLSSTSGMIGLLFHNFLKGTISNFLYVLMPISLLILALGMFNISLHDVSKKVFQNTKIIFFKIKNIIADLTKKNNSVISATQENSIINETDSKDIIKEKDVEKESEISELENTSISENDIIIDEEESINETNIDNINQSNYDNYKLPSSDLLNDPVEITNFLSEQDLKQKATNLVHALETFGVQGEVIRISPGPVITLFEIEPAEGVRVNKFTTLADDLARVMQAQRIRIIAPIPGSRSVGVELPNENPQIVFLKTILNSEQYADSRSKLTIAIGKTTTGNAFVIELDKLPHLLVAGATGAGKSVCINTIIMSILYKAKPDEVKFVLIDPKKLELSTYKQLVGYHLITSPNFDEYVMTTAENAVGILDAAINEMERRFSVFADAGVRNISEYHQKQVDNNLEKIPYVVVLIDELADLMMTSSRAIEDPITRLAQKARAVGIHLVVATQRPSVDVITGLIKSNFPARISFQVSSRVDSRTIIDQMGAEKLLGKGDMLFLEPGSASPVRLHNAFVTLEEIEKVLSHINTQPKPDEIKLPEVKTNTVNNDSTSFNSDHDDLLKDAAFLVIETGQASVSLLQRRFRIGYSRAGRLIDELESMGIVSGHSGSKAREVLVDKSYIQNIFET